jgi:predicted HAD superfamily phosphohydrolase YqeG
MSTKKKVIIELDVTIPLPEGVTWPEFITHINEEKNQQLLKKISPATFRFILDENNHSKIIKSLLKTLKQTCPKNATKEYAEKMLGAMREMARTILG